MNLILIKNILSTLIIFIFFCSAALAKNNLITDYHQIFIPLYDNKENLKIAIRKFYVDNKIHYLTVNPYNFATETAPAENYKPRKIVKGSPGYYKMAELQQTPYMKALLKYSSEPYKLENHGITHAQTNIKGTL